MKLNLKLSKWTDEKYIIAMEDLIEKHQIKCRELDGKQLAGVIVQALACGDIQKLVVAGTGSQSIIYIPFSDAERLKSRIRLLEDLLDKHEIKEDKPDWRDS